MHSVSFLQYDIEGKLGVCLLSTIASLFSEYSVYIVNVQYMFVDDDKILLLADKQKESTS